MTFDENLLDDLSLWATYRDRGSYRDRDHWHLLVNLLRSLWYLWATIWAPFGLRLIRLPTCLPLGFPTWHLPTFGLPYLLEVTTEIIGWAIILLTFGH